MGMLSASRGVRPRPSSIANALATEPNRVLGTHRLRSPRCRRSRALLYWAVRRLLKLILLGFRSEDAKEVEIVVLRHQLHVLKRQVARPDLGWHDRALLAAASRVLPQMRWRSFLVRPETVLAWHRKLVQRRWTYPRRAGRPSKRAEVRRLAVRFAKENPTWGYRRIQGELTHLGITIAPSTVWEILRREGIDPAPRRTGLSLHGANPMRAAVPETCLFIRKTCSW